MADVAAIFHWPPSAFDACSIDEVMAWRARAIDRAEVLGLARRQ